MSRPTLGRVEKFLAVQIVELGRLPRLAVADTVDRFSDATGLQAAFCLVAIANGSSSYFQAPPETLNIPKIHEACAILAADLFALETLETRPATSCAALAKFWSASDGYFKPHRALQNNKTTPRQV